ncbi:MAG: hypothetical protein JRE28_16700 [Deltaproteobacteria bacterium]|nr:hypothetical protein [Deltaproteobacteria bacterium]
MVKLGDRVKDVISGFTGIAVAETKWLHGCCRICVQPPVDKDGKHQENQTFDEPQLEVLKTSDVPKIVPSAMQRGGDRENVGARQNIT